MLSSSSQYYNPDYLQPLPTTLDAKKSPLALLAQTCSSIGKDSTPAKSLIPPIERKDVPKDKDRASSRPKSCADTPGRCKSSGSDAAGEGKKPQHSPSSKKGTPDLLKASSSGAKDSSNKDSAKSPRDGSPSRTKSSAEHSSETRDRSNGSVPLPPALSTSTSQSTSSLSLGLGQSSESSLTDSSSKPLGASHHAWLAAHRDTNGLPGLPGLSYPGYPYPLFAHPSLPLDTSSHHLRLAAAAGLSGASSAALSPYGVGYTKVKTASGAHTLVPVCRDPYCNHCQASAQAAQLGGSATGACPAGCTQCAHGEKHSHPPSSLSSAHASALAGLPPLYTLSSAAPGMSSLALSSLYPHLGSLPGGAPGLPPIVCNWMNGSDYCGKRFTTSEELLQHLRTHTSATDASAAALSLAGLPYGGLGLPGLAPHLPTPGSLSPDSALRAHYTRSLSPSSLLAASRYHPYKSALSSLTPPGASAYPGATAAALPPHLYSPYALYGQRLGAAAP